MNSHRELVNTETVLCTLIAGMVTEPQEVRIQSVTTDNVTIYTIRVAPRDFGLLIGRGGRIARSLRIVMGAIAARAGERIALNIPNGDRVGGAGEPLPTSRT